MAKQNFAHLHIHNEFSFLDGLGKAEHFAEEAARRGFEFLGLTNHGNVDGAIKFQKECGHSQIQSLIGCELYVVDDIAKKEKGEFRYHMTVLVKNQTGWQNLLQMLTVANLDGFYWRPRVSPKLVLEFSRGLVFMTGCSSSFVKAPFGDKLFGDLFDAVGDDLYLEFMPHTNFLDQALMNRLLLDLAKKFDVGCVATNDCHYPTVESQKAQEVLLAIQSKARWKDPNRWRLSVEELYLKSEQEMLDTFRQQNVLTAHQAKKAIWGTLDVADRCSHFKIKKLKVNLPKVPGYEDVDENKLFSDIIEAGYKKRILKRKQKQAAPLKAYRDRIKEETGLITELGFVRYFLIVWELIQWCKKKGILTGPGRGSVGGSLVAYLMEITGVDPFAYGLVFSRFISPARIDLPDIDMDFEDVRRPEIRTHLEEAYGKNNIAGVSTFMSLKGRGALRDVARVFEVAFSDVDKAAKSIVVRSGGDSRADFSIADSFQAFEDGKEFSHKHPEVTNIAMELEGQVRGVGQHAAGMCISEDNLQLGKRCNLSLRKGTIVANWDKHDAEYAGMMKLDVLGLSALTILSKTRKDVKRNHKVDIEFDEIPLDEAGVFAEIAKGNTVGAFQIGSMGLSRFCREIKVSCFEELVQATSLWRPGTLRAGMTTEFVLRKNGEKEWDYVHPALEELTKETYGIILYQEQVMRFMYDFAGLPWKTCDTIRKVISKSQGDELFHQFKELFVEGCKKKETLDPETAGKLWDQLTSFGSYGFNKCLSGDTTILVPSGCGMKRITLAQAFKDKPQHIYSFDPKLKKSIKVPVKKISSSGRKVVYLVVCRTNRIRKIKATLDHRFMTTEGWAKLRDLSVGDKVLVKAPSTLLYGKDNPAFGKMDNVRNYRSPIAGKKLPDYWKKSMSRAAKARTVHGHKGHKHSDETKAKIRAKTLKQMADGRMPQSMTSIQLKVKDHMIKNGLWDGFSLEHNFKDRYSIDIANPELRIAIECQGDYWHANPRFYSKRNQTQGRNVGRDKNKKRMLEKNGWEVVELWEHDIKNSIDACLDRIRESINDCLSNPWEFAAIENIERIGIEETFDVHVDHPCHNFIANMFVVHNSHATEYSMITYWDMWCKVHYPTEFMAATLTYGSADKKEEYIEECKNLNLEIVMPKVGISHPTEWQTRKGENKLYVPLYEVKGVGKKTAETVAQLAKKRKGGFFELEEDKSVRKPNKTVMENLAKLHAFEPDRKLTIEEAEELEDLFAFDVSPDPMRRIRGIQSLLESRKLLSKVEDIDFSKPSKEIKLYLGKIPEIKFGFREKLMKGKGKMQMEGTAESLGGVYGMFKTETDVCMSVFANDVYKNSKSKVEHCDGKWLLIKGNHPRRATCVVCEDFADESELQNCDIGQFDLNLISAVPTWSADKIKQCSLCEYREQCSEPVPPQTGSFNIMAIGESPGDQEDRSGIPFVGPAGKLLWKEAGRHSISRQDLHVTNTIKCRPPGSPSAKVVKICSKRWLTNEIKKVKPVVVLALGTKTLLYFKGLDSGIMALNGKTEWSVAHNCWICWCIHPAAVLYNRESQEGLFKEGIANFARCLNNIGWGELR